MMLSNNPAARDKLLDKKRQAGSVYDFPKQPASISSPQAAKAKPAQVLPETQAKNGTT